MDLLHVAAPRAPEQPRLLLMLPAAYARPADFVEQGLVAALHERAPSMDVVLAGPALAQHADGSAAQRLHDEVVAPARRRGMRELWLLGVSIGGLLAMSYAARHPGLVQGLVLLAPYAGRRTLQAQLRRAGSAAAWTQGRDPQPDDTPEHEVWAWLGRGQGQPLIHLGYGREDRFADGHRLLATELPAERVIEREGGHDWPCWRRLWGDWLARGLLDAQAAPTAAATEA